MNIVVDTNVLISALIKDSITRNLIFYLPYTLLLPELELEEIENHKSEILLKSGLSELELDELLSNLLKYFKIIKTEEVIEYKETAHEIIGHIDEDDVIFFATALAFNCQIWSDDSHFKKQQKIEIITTLEMLDLKNHNPK